MGQPAARVGDQTSHGGVIVGPGVPMVLIGGMPAAVMGDQHVCPMLNPGVPPPPHVGGPIMATAAMVLIGGKPAARVTDQAICSGPPAQIIMGCMMVLIGDGGGGGGGAGQAGAAQQGQEKAEAATGESHYLDVKFQDKGGKPITGVAYGVTGPGNMKGDGKLTGQVKRSGLEQGSYEIALRAITKIVWSAKQARDGDKVKMQIEVAGVDPAAKATFEVWEKDANKADRMIAAVNDVAVNGGKAEAEWTYEFGDDDEKVQQAKGYASPIFYFVARIDGLGERSPFLDYKDFIEIELRDADGQPVPNEIYRLYLSNGEVREGKLDGNGYAKEAGIRPGQCRVVFPDAGEVS